MKKVILLLLGGVMTGTTLLLGQVTSPGFDPGYAAALQSTLAHPTFGGPSGFKGLSAAVMVPGQGRWIGTWGISEPGVPITPDMRFCVASNTKTFVAALCLKLQDEGLLHLDDSIGQYLPPFQHINPSITVRQLLSHQSGLFDCYNDASGATLNTYNNNPDSVWSAEAVLATIGPPHFLPGKSYRYSNTNFIVASMVCEAAAGDSFRNLLHQRIFEPLGLTKTAYPAGGDDVFSAPWASLFVGISPGLDPLHANGFNSFIQGAGGIWSTANDMASWFVQLFDGDFLSEQSQAALRRVEPWSSYSLGMRAKNTSSATLHYHSGAWGYRAMTMYDANTGIVVCVLSNLQGKSLTNLADQLVKTAVEQLPKKDTDLALLSILKPNGPVCSLDSLKLKVRNEGLLPVSSLTLQARLDGIPFPSASHALSPALAPGEERILSQPLIAGGSNEVSTIEVEVQAPGDGNPFNDQDKADFYTQPQPVVSYEETFGYIGATLPVKWISGQSDNVQDWRLSPFAGQGGALCKNNFEDANIGGVYILDLPLLQFSDAQGQARLLFDYAYAPYPGFAEDTLEVLYSPDCGFTFQSIWKKGGTELQTAPATTASFLPGPGEWQEGMVEGFGKLAGGEMVRLRAINRYGNNIWLDNLRIETLTNEREPASSALVKMYPNPFSQATTLDFGRSLSNGHLLLSDSQGRVLWEKSGVSGQFAELSRQGLPDGVYFLLIAEETQGASVVRLMVVK